MHSYLASVSTPTQMAQPLGKQSNVPTVLQHRWHRWHDHLQTEQRTHDVLVALTRVELDRKAAGVADGLRGPALVDDRREARDQGRLHSRRAQKVGARDVRDVVRHLHRTPGQRLRAVVLSVSLGSCAIAWGLKQGESARVQGNSQS